MSDVKLVVISVDELRVLIRDELGRVLQSRPDVPRWHDISAAAEHFGVNPQTVRNWIRAGAPAVQVGSPARPLYRLELRALQGWLEARP